MSKFILSPLAQRDIEEIWSYYAEKLSDLDLAQRIRLDLLEALRKLAQSPGIGHHRSDLAAKPVRFWRVGKNLVIYIESEDGIDVARILHGSRDVRSILEE